MKHNQQQTRNVVNCDTTEEFLDRYYKPDRFRGRGEEYAQVLIDSHEQDFIKDGYDLISYHDSVLGVTVWRYPKPAPVKGWEGPHQWISEMIAAGDIDAREAFNALMDKIDAEDIQDVFGAEMRDSGYFGDEDEEMDRH